MTHKIIPGRRALIKTGAALGTGLLVLNLAAAQGSPASTLASH